MGPSTIDLFILTFNCAKTLINVPVFANHLHAALSQEAKGLPELVVFSLQEMSPLSTAFIGSYFLAPYYQRFESALNLAATKFLLDADPEAVRPPSPPTLNRRKSDFNYYTLMRTRNVGMTAIMLFARDPTALHSIQAAEVGFGAAEMANKGAVGLRVLYQKGGAGSDSSSDGVDVERKEAELTFVATHLAAMEWNLEKRNKNWATVVSGLLFGDPKKVVRNSTVASTTKAKNSSAQDGDADDAQPLLGDAEAESEISAKQQRELQDLTIYKPTSQLFVSGDLNYRISSTSPPSDAVFPSRDEVPADYLPFFKRDQLTEERKNGRALHGLSEAAINFPPTYKIVVLPPDEPETAVGAAGDAGELTNVRGEGEDAGADISTGEDKVDWIWASHRWPGWCDRILFMDIPGWASSANAQLKPRVYNAMPVVRTSDHRPVFLRVDVPVLEPGELEPPADYVTEAGGAKPDPRIKLPVPIDFDALEKRARLRRYELYVGATIWASSSKAGLGIITTALLLGLSGWWFRGSY